MTYKTNFSDGTREYLGTATELAAMTASDKSGIAPGSSFYVYDTKVAYIFADGDWRAM
jgi:hypothetical protein